MNRNLDGCYFRLKRNGQYQNICFSDLTEEEQKMVLKGRSGEWMKSLCLYLAHMIKNIGDQLDIVRKDDAEEDA